MESDPEIQVICADSQGRGGEHYLIWMLWLVVLRHLGTIQLFGLSALDWDWITSTDVAVRRNPSIKNVQDTRYASLLNG